MRFCWLLLYLTGCMEALSQSQQQAFPGTAIQYTRDVYFQRVQGESLLYNGTDYVRYIPLKDEYPYFLSDDWLEGTISYDDQVYEKVWMYYNTYTDNVIIENYNFANSIQLIKERILYFIIEGRKFIRVTHPSLAPGFYELAYDGESRVLIKHIKQFHSSIESGELIHKFLEKTRYYVLKNDQYHLVNSKGSVLKILRENRREVSQQFRNTGIDYRSARALGITTLARLHDELK